ncbi:MAG: spore germination protein [Clostridia bacterium]|nr:spore germination protein [Clostridia bacterium]
MSFEKEKRLPLSESFAENLIRLRARLGVGKSFDVIERELISAGVKLSFFYIDGFVKDGEMQRVMQALLAMKQIPSVASVEERLPYVEVTRATGTDEVVCAVLSGQTAVLGESFGGMALLVDARTYPAREPSEPDSDRVMQGARDGFVETLVVNTALIRRRIRDERLTMEHFNLGGLSKTDVVVCYLRGECDELSLANIRARLGSIKPRSLTLGFQSLAECLIGRGWLNPFPKIRSTERPDTAAAQLAEGSILVICDTSPQVMILPTSIFSYLEQTDDFYFPPLTGTYLRIIRTAILLLSLFITPLWYLALEYGEALPQALSFLIPDEPGALPIILQLFLAEIAIDGLKIASLNTPDTLSSSLSIIGALILGDFAVGVGWLSEDVILYMAFVAIANFAQQNHELGYAIKFMRILMLALVFLLGWVGLLIGIIVFVLLIVTNKTVDGKRHYLYPLFPFNKRALSRLVVRHRKREND